MNDPPLPESDRTQAATPEQNKLSAETSLPPKNVPLQIAGRYELEGVIAKGGMGEIHKAWDHVMKRTVAVKLLLDKSTKANHVHRFNYEAHITGQLQHPSIPPVHDMGTLPDGNPFLVMKLIKGDTLDALIRRSNPRAERRKPPGDDMRENCLKTVFELAKQDERVVFIGSDLGVGVLNDFKKEIPSRFFMEGVYEQNLVGLAAGMAMEGNIVYVNTIATFLSRRCYEQVAVDLCLHNVNVRLIANGGGVVYAPLGPTHLAIEDIAIMRALPNMTIVAPADSVEMVRFMKVSVDYAGPIYIRVAKGHDPIVTSDTGPFVIGKAVPMRDGEEVLLVTTGVGLQICLAAAEKLEASGVNAAVLHFPTIKPFDTEALHAHAEDLTR